MQVLDTTPCHGDLPLFSADRISRQGDRSLGRLRLDQETRMLLGQNRIGLFIEGFLGLETMIGRLLPIADGSSEGRTLVLYPSKQSRLTIHDMLSNRQACEYTPRPPVTWNVGNLTFTSIEALPKLRLDDQERIVQVILLDPTCMVYKARNYRLGNGRHHDRAQILANFVDDCSEAGIAPVFTIMTCKKSFAVPTQSVAQAFCLEAWWFLDGPTLRVPR